MQVQRKHTASIRLLVASLVSLESLAPCPVPPHPAPLFEYVAPLTLRPVPPVVAVVSSTRSVPPLVSVVALILITLITLITPPFF